eukprot:5943398-Amphidinium_carterae.1
MSSAADVAALQALIAPDWVVALGDVERREYGDIAVTVGAVAYPEMYGLSSRRLQLSGTEVGRAFCFQRTQRYKGLVVMLAFLHPNLLSALEEEFIAEIEQRAKAGHGHSGFVFDADIVAKTEGRFLEDSRSTWGL